MLTHYPTLDAAAAAVCAECGGPAPAGPARTCHRMPAGWLILCPECSPEHHEKYRAARVAAETAERAARLKPAEPNRTDGEPCRTLDEPYRLFPDRTFVPRRRHR